MCTGHMSKWLGVIFDDSLDFDIHGKSGLAKARKALGSGCVAVGNVPRVEKSIRRNDPIHCDMGRVGMERAKGMGERIQPAAVLGTVQGIAMGKVNWVAGVEDVIIPRHGISCTRVLNKKKKGKEKKKVIRQLVNEPIRWQSKTAGSGTTTVLSESGGKERRTGSCVL